MPMKLIFTYLAGFLLSGCILNDSTGPSGTPVDFTEIDSGFYSNLSYPAGDYVFSVSADYEAFYNELVCSVTIPCTIPAVDFSTDMVLAVVMGQRSSGGYSIDIKEVFSNNETLSVVVETMSPAPGDVVTLALTNPYDIVTIAKTDLTINFLYE